MPRSDRLFALAYLLAGPKRHRLDELVSRLESTPRTIYRDLAALESRGFPIERVNGTYRLMDGAPPPALPLTARERFLLLLALGNPSVEHQPGLRGDLRRLRSKLAGQIGDGARVAVLTGPDRTGTISPEVFESIEQSIRESHSLSVLYTSLTTGTPQWRGVDPWVLFHRSEAWYLAGRCHLHDELRTFRLDRITGVLPIGTSFARPDDFDVNQWLARRWGIFDGDPVEAVVVFDTVVAPLIEHGLHHPGESKRRLEDGRIEYRVGISSLEELARWITGFGGKAIAVAPPALIARVREISSGALEVHRERKPARRSTGRTLPEERRRA